MWRRVRLKLEGRDLDAQRHTLQEQVSGQGVGGWGEGASFLTQDNILGFIYLKK